MSYWRIAGAGSRPNKTTAHRGAGGGATSAPLTSRMAYASTYVLTVELLGLGTWIET